MLFQVQYNNHVCSIVYFEKNANLLSESVASLNLGAVSFPDNEIQVRKSVNEKSREQWKYLDRYSVEYPNIVLSNKRQQSSLERQFIFLK